MMRKPMPQPNRKRRPSSTEIPVWQVTLDILLYPEGGVFIAHCLQTDTASQGATEAVAFKALCEALEAELEEAISDGDLARVFEHRAPQSLWKLRESARQEFAHIRLDAPSLPSEHREFFATKYLVSGVA